MIDVKKIWSNDSGDAATAHANRCTTQVTTQEHNCIVCHAEKLTDLTNWAQNNSRTHEQQMVLPLRYPGNRSSTDVAHVMQCRIHQREGLQHKVCAIEEILLMIDVSKKLPLRGEVGRGYGSGTSVYYAQHIQRTEQYHLENQPLAQRSEQNNWRYLPGSPEYAMRRWGLRALILSSSTFIFTIERAEVVSAATIT